MSKVKATGYLVIQANREKFGTKDPETGLLPIYLAKITQARQNRPESLGQDEILVKVTVELPEVAFDPIVPQALVIVPEDMILDRHEIEVLAGDGDQ